MVKRKDVNINAVTAEATAAMVSASVTAVARNKKGVVKAIRHGNDERQHSTNYQNGTMQESASKVNKLKLKRTDKKGIEKAVAYRLLPIFNKINCSNYVVIDEDPEESSINDVILEDKNSRNRIGIQITASDENAISLLNRTNSLSRSGNAYRLHSEAIKKRINDKTGYDPAERKKTILALDGWPGVSDDILKTFKKQESDFLKKAGYKEIWFVGIIDEFIIRLYP